MSGIHHLWRRRALACALTLLAGAGSGQAWSQSAPSAEEAAFLAENDAAMNRMMDAMAPHPSGDIDQDFVAMMAPHHQGAIDMAKVVLAHGKDPEIRKLAESVVRDQEKEVAQMREWLRKNGK